MKRVATVQSAGSDPLAAQAIDGVLEAERDAQAAVAACEGAPVWLTPSFSARTTKALHCASWRDSV